MYRKRTILEFKIGKFKLRISKETDFNEYHKLWNRRNNKRINKERRESYIILIKQGKCPRCKRKYVGKGTICKICKDKRKLWKSEVRK